jgi:hypothetical protein
MIVDFDEKKKEDEMFLLWFKFVDLMTIIDQIEEKYKYIFRTSFINILFACKI